MSDPQAQGRVSVVITTYNRGALVTRAIISALSQCREGDEVIVVDDQSDDDTEERLIPYRDRITYKKISHGGAGRARNVGLSLAKNSLVAFLDSDDEWMPGKLSLQRILMAARPDVLFCYTEFKCRYPSGREDHNLMHHYGGEEWFIKHLGPGIPYSSIAPLPEGQGEVNVHIGSLYAMQMEMESVSVGTLLFRREGTGDSLRFPEDLETREDWEFVGRLARKGLAAFLNCETQIVHVHDGPQLTKIENANALRAILKLEQRVWGSDETFLKEHGRHYREVLDGLRLRLIKRLLSTGHPHEARKELKQIRQAPIFLRAICYVPGILTSTIVRARSSIWKTYSRHSWPGRS